MQSLRWEGHENAIITEVARFYREGVNVDCSFLVEGQYLKGHKVILCACSPYFQELFEWKSGKNPIPLRDVNYNAMKYIMNYVYNGVVDVPVDEFESFIRASKSFQIKGLEKLYANINVNNLEIDRNKHFNENVRKETFHGGDNYCNVNSKIQGNVNPVNDHQPQNFTGADYQNDYDNNDNNGFSDADSNGHEETQYITKLEKTKLEKNKFPIKEETQEDRAAEKSIPQTTSEAPVKVKKKRTYSDKRYLCIYCPATYANRNILQEHLIIHTGETQLLCQDCYFSFSTRADLVRHREKHLTGERLWDDSSALPFEEVPPLPSGLLEKVPEEVLTPPGGKRFTVVKSPGGKRFRCGFCSTEFAHRGHLRVHLRTHTGEKPYLCRYCGAEFARKWNLKCHIRSHTGEKAFTCQMCPAAFAKKESLVKHVVLCLAGKTQQLVVT